MSGVVSTAMIPPPLEIRPELTDADVDWLNAHARLANLRVDYRRELPSPPPLPSGRIPRRADRLG